MVRRRVQVSINLHRLRLQPSGPVTSITATLEGSLLEEVEPGVCGGALVEWPNGSVTFTRVDG